MSDERGKPGWAFWSTVAVTLLAVYGGAYWALLDSPQWSETVTVYLSGPGGEGNYIDVPAEGARLVPRYRLVGAAGNAIFGPAHWVDRKLRQYWAAPDQTVMP